MDLPAFLRFAPVPLRARHNGWTPALQLRFVVALARGAGVDEAARALGKTRQSAYDLRKKPGGESFAAAWDSAQALARRAAAAGCAPAQAHHGIETMLVPRSISSIPAGLRGRLTRRLPVHHPMRVRVGRVVQ